MLAQVLGVENPEANYLSRLDIWTNSRIYLKLTDSIEVFQVENASKTPKQEEDKTDYYPHDETNENIRKHRSNTLQDKTLGQKEHKHPTAQKTMSTRWQRTATMDIRKHGCKTKCTSLD